MPFWVSWSGCVCVLVVPGTLVQQGSHVEGDLTKHVGIKSTACSGWLTLGDAALETGSEVLLITETTLIPTMSRNECAKLR